MIPILYDAALSDATFITNGICRLSDTISCKVTEERNGAYTLEMEYPFGGIHADELTVQRIIKAKANDISDLQCFRITSVTQSLDGKRLNVKANHISYDLSYFPVTPFSGTFNSVATAISGILNNAVNPSGFYNSADYVPGSAVSYSLAAPRSIKACLGGQAGSVLDLFGGEYEWDNRLIKWHTARGQDRGVTIRYGKNLTNYEQETNIEDTVCGILPVYNMDNVVVYGDIQYSANASSFPFLKVAVMDFTSDFTSTDGESTAPTPAQLEARAASYIEANNIGQPEVSIDVEFYPIWQTEDYADYKALETVGLCDTVTVIFPDLNVRTKAKVVKTVYNTLLEKYISVSLGSIRRNIADTIAEMEDSGGGSSSGGGGGGGITVDDTLSTTSENPVQNKVITTALNGKQSKLTKLWTNGSPTSAMSSGTTILNDGTLANYDLFAIKFKEQANSSGSSEFFFWYSKTSGSNLTTARWVSRSGSNLFFRTRSFSITNSGMTFQGGEQHTQGSSSAASNNLYMVPWEVYGLKL